MIELEDSNIFVDEESMEWKSYLRDKFGSLIRKPKESSVSVPKVKVSKAEKLEIYTSLLEQYNKYSNLVFANEYAIRKNNIRLKVYGTILGSLKGQLKIKEGTFIECSPEKKVILYETMLGDYGKALIKGEGHVSSEEEKVYSFILDSLKKDIKKR